MRVSNESMLLVPPRPKITLPIPGQYGRYPQTPAGYASTPYNQTPAPITPVPVTPVSGQPQVFYSNRASEFVFTQFKGIKDFTKSGLSVGERSVFWLYEKVSSWSKRWFTHIFLVVIVFLYSVAGAMIFITIEGTNEDIFHLNIRQERNKTIELIRELWDDEVLASDVELWKGGARRELMKYEEHLYEFYKLGVIDRGEKVWTFWNAVFYCGTIYTTIEAHTVTRFFIVDELSTMEDSYTVHRRRKAAAKRREKTPEPSSRSQLVETSEDEEEIRRARMEKMAEDTERMEEMEKERKVKGQEKDGRLNEEQDQKEGTHERKKTTNGKRNTIQLEDVARRDMISSQATTSLINRSREIDNDNNVERNLQQDIKVPSKMVEEEAEEEDIGKKETLRIREDESELIDTRKVEKRTKKRSKDRTIERHPRSTDSSEEKSETSPSRLKSSEIVRPRTRKSTGRARMNEGDKSVREKHSFDTKIRPKDKPEKKSLQQPPDPNESITEGATMKKSESFPPRSLERQPIVKRSATDVKKQVIPLSNDSLIEDFAKAQREYLLRERSILDPDLPEDYQEANEIMAMRRRKIGMIHSESEHQEIINLVKNEPVDSLKSSWYSRFTLFSFFMKKKKTDSSEIEKEREDMPKNESIEEITNSEKEHINIQEKVTFLDFLRALKDIASELKAFMTQNPIEMRIIRKMRNRCIAQLILIMIYCGLGAFVFRFTEGAFETFYKCGVKRVKRDFLDSLWNYSHNLREDDWKSLARRKLMEFEEQLHTAHEAGVHTYSGQRSWTFLNAVVYCLTVITTIGYGHISPSTTTGRAITIVYAIFGIPMFLILLADFGKLFTRGIKFLWAFVRRLYYTGSCRKVRGTVPVQEVMKGVQLVYDLATFRRPSQMNPEDIEEIQKQQNQQAVLNIDGNAPDTPGTPAMSTFAIDDEFNLPISVAIFILLGYIFIGATLYNAWEQWGFFESFYFVFISMSTIGFGDYVPKHPMYMMCSIIYLVFGLALTSMCINVVQVMLSDSFKQASQKIGATIGFEIADDDGSVKPAPPPPVEVADIHTSIKDSESVEKIAPKAKQEDVDL
ncbi:uncharacterized protein LOC124955363 isoform X2 [Vespa velutina]|uniref:uncharacterized protein LOC124955363 isoform X2 n=1 Tax=Vespa velutina TaxID=202808 RepID=UPI001FB40D87|nr:uncharacterized protein LOC124955363 isoform X2 [Vespa velutina]